jgi:hypothetical protein
MVGSRFHVHFKQFWRTDVIHLVEVNCFFTFIGGNNQLPGVHVCNRSNNVSMVRKLNRFGKLRGSLPGGIREVGLSRVLYVGAARGELG